MKIVNSVRYAAIKVQTKGNRRMSEMPSCYRRKLASRMGVEYKIEEGQRVEWKMHLDFCVSNGKWNQQRMEIDDGPLGVPPFVDEMKSFPIEYVTRHARNDSTRRKETDVSRVEPSQQTSNFFYFSFFMRRGSLVQDFCIGMHWWNVF